MKLYCNICETETEHTYKGEQRGIPWKSLELYDCVKCHDTCGRWINKRDIRNNNSDIGD